MRQDIIDLYDDYTHARLDRRDFMDQLARLAGGSAAAAALLPLLKANYASAALIAPDDARLTTGRVSFPGARGEMQAYIARPSSADQPMPAVMVIHENRGLNPHIEDVVRRMALEGFLALGPDFLSPAGGTPDDEDQAREMIGALDPEETLANALAVIDYLKRHEQGNSRTGAVGFCWGGGLCNRIAAHSAAINAVVSYYGRQASAEEAAKIDTPLMLHYAGLDERINAGIADFEAILRQSDADYTLYMYDGVNHAFNNDTAAARYDKEAAELAWSRTIDFLNQHLRA